MAYDFQAVTAASDQSDYITWLDDDKPLLGVQRIPVSPDVAIWSNADEAAVGGETGGTPRTNTTYPIKNAYDDLVDLVTKPSVAVVTDNVWYIVFDLGITVTIDMAAIIGHNFGTLGGVTITLEVDDVGTFDSGNLQTIATWTTPTDDDRLIELELKHTGSVALEYFDLQFIRLKIAAAGDIIPEVGDLFLGKRYQLKSNPRVGFDPTSLHGESEITRTGGGVVHKIIRHDRRFDLNASLRPSVTNRINDIINWYRGASRAFIWIREPGTSPNTWHYMIRYPDDLDFPSGGYSKRDVTIQAIEQGPENYYMDQE